jgi:hypothetical protein
VFFEKLYIISGFGFFKTINRKTSECLNIKRKDHIMTCTVTGLSADYINAYECITQIALNARATTELLDAKARGVDIDDSRIPRYPNEEISEVAQLIRKIVLKRKITGNQALDLAFRLDCLPMPITWAPKKASLSFESYIGKTLKEHNIVVIQ